MRRCGGREQQDLAERRADAGRATTHECSRSTEAMLQRCSDHVPWWLALRCRRAMASFLISSVSEHSGPDLGRAFAVEQ